MSNSRFFRAVALRVRCFALAPTFAFLWLGAGLLPALAQIPSRVLYQENFEQYGVKAPGFTEACRVVERPPSRKYLEFRPAEGQEAMVFAKKRGPMLTGAGPQEAELAFRFRFPAESKKSFDVHLFLGDDPAGASAHRLRVMSGGEGFPPFLPNVWYTAQVRIRGRAMELLVNPSGEPQRVARLETGGGACAGFNFSGSTSVDFERLVFCSPGGDLAPIAAPVPSLAGPPLAAPLERKLDLPECGGRIAATLALGIPAAGASIVLGWADGTTSSIRVTVAEASWDRKMIEGEKVVSQKASLPEAMLIFEEVRPKGGGMPWRIQRWVRPNPGYYDTEERMALAAAWNRLPSASTHGFRFEARPDDAGVALWIDHRYAGRIERDVRLASVLFQLPAGGFLGDASVLSPSKEAPWLALDVGGLSAPGVMEGARLSIPAGEREVRGVPMVVASGDRGADLGVVREHLGSFGLDCDGYLSRHAFCGVPESLLISVPRAQYVRAWVLCAVEEDPSKDAVFTARLTRFLSMGAFSGRGSAIADTAVVLPRAAGPEAANAAGVRLTKVGSVECPAGGKVVSLPLWLVEVPLKVGEIQDLLFQETGANRTIPSPYLDFDLLGKTDYAKQQLDRSHKPDPTSTSGVHVFAVTLEKGPVEMEVRPASFGNVYEVGERAEMTVALRSVGASRSRLRWEIRDVEGRQVSRGEESAEFSKGGQEKKVIVPLAPETPGWYGAHFSLLDNDGRLLVEHPSSFVRVEKDARTAGYESPYHAWWFGGTHGGTNDLNVIGPLFLRAGIRKSCSFGLKGEETAAPWKLTLAQFPYQRIDPSKSDEETLNRLGAKIEQWKKQFPHTEEGVVLHENYSGEFPVELLDEPTPNLTPAEIEKDRKLVRCATLNVKVYRERFKDVKTVVGNCGNSLAVMAGLFRNKFPAESIDFLGNEEVGQTVPPEMSVALSNWMLKDLARRFGYDRPVNACYEWIARTNRDLGPRKRAEWGVRDDLIAHAWGQKLVPVPGVVEPSNSYYNTVWGSGWMFSRNPQFYPFPCYAATATLTRVLDGASFARLVPTGSLTVYALEFKRGKGFVYALWTARGRVEANLEFPSNGRVSVTGLYGDTRESSLSEGRAFLALDGAATYVASATPLKQVTLGARTFPEDRVPDRAKLVVADTMRKAADWHVSPGVDSRIENPPKHGNYPPFRRPGNYQVRAARDPEKGDCIEIELVKEGNSPTLMEEYTVLRPKAPIPVEGKPDTLGVWVKGNSGWGRVMWEFEDAEGEVWLSCGTGGYGCSVQDWPCQAALNFDGWDLLQFPLVQSSPIRLPTAGDVHDQWLSSGGNRRIDYPIKLTGLVVSMTRKALHLTEMVEVPTALRFRDLCAHGSQ